MNQGRFLFFLLLTYTIISFRLLPAMAQPGTQDLSFGDNGVADILLSDNHQVYDFAVASDGSIYVVGSYNDGNQQSFITKFFSDGTFDAAFGISYHLDFNVSEYYTSISLTTDNKIVVAGDGDDIGYSEMMVRRYNINGSIDNTFGTGGLVKSDPLFSLFGLSNGSSLHKVLVDPNDQSIFLVGMVRSGSFTDNVMIAKLSSAGTLDNSFGTGGAFTGTIYGADAYEEFKDAVIGSDGNIYAVGVTKSDWADPEFVLLVKLNANGAYVPDFSGLGYTRFQMPSNDNAKGYAIKLQSDNKIVVAGQYIDVDNLEAFVARLNTNGTFDNSFATNGVYTWAYDVYTDFMNDLIIDNAGNIYAVGKLTELVDERMGIIGLDTDGNDLNGFPIAFKQGGNQFTIGRAIKFANDGDLLLGGYTKADNNPITQELLYLTKFSPGASGGGGGGGGPYTVNFSIGSNGSANPNTAQVVNDGDKLIVTITPATGYDIENITFNGVNQSSNLTLSNGVYTLTLTPTASGSLFVSFRRNQGGVSMIIEDGAPNNGDGNGDGIPDRLQDNVASIRNAGNREYITLAVEDCDYMFDVNPLPSNDPEAYLFPYGMVEFKVPCSEANVTLIFHSLPAFTDFVYRKISSAGNYFEFTNARFGQMQVGGKTVATVRLNLKDGGPEDFDGIINGVIYDPGGPATLATANIPLFNFTTRLIIIFGLLFAGAIYIRKRMFA